MSCCEGLYNSLFVKFALPCVHHGIMYIVEGNRRVCEHLLFGCERTLSGGWGSQWKMSHLVDEGRCPINPPLGH